MTTATPSPGPARPAWWRATRRFLRDAVRKNLSLKVIAGAMAVVAWLLVQGRPTAEEYATITVDYTWPDALVLDTQPVNQVLIKAVGPRSNLRELGRRDLSYTIDLSDMAPGETTLYLTGMPVNDLPAGIEITTISPSSLTFRFDERITKALPVHVPTRGEVAFGFEVEEIVIEPDVVTLSGAASDLEPLERISTRLLDLTGRDKDYAELLPLDLGTMHIRPEHDSEVSVFVRMRQLIEERPLDVSVVLPAALSAGRVEPEVATVLLKGPARELHRASSSHVAIEVVLDGVLFRDGIAKVSYDPEGRLGLRVNTDELPASIEILEVRPTSFTVYETNP